MQKDVTIEYYHRNCAKYANFLLHYSHLWAYRNEFESCFRQNLLLHGTNTINYVEVDFRILKDCIFDTIMVLNVA